MRDTLKMQRYDRFLTYKEQMSKFIKKSVTSNQSSYVLLDYSPIYEIKIATFSVISEKVCIFASSNKNSKIWHKLKRIIEK